MSKERTFHRQVGAQYLGGLLDPEKQLDFYPHYRMQLLAWRDKKRLYVKFAPNLPHVPGTLSVAW